MLKRLGISFCILLAFAMLQAHNFIAHHHEEVEISHHHHHSNGDAHEHEKKNHTDDSNSPFNDATHTADFGKIIAKPDAGHISFESPLLIAYLLTPLYNKLACFNNPPRPHPPDNDATLHLIFLSHSLPLRAPPASSCLS